jgi:histidinol-phosphate aminotransferase
MTTDLPVREALRGLPPYGAPQLDVPVRLNTNENPYPPPVAVVAELATAAAQAAAGLNRYPERDAVALRADLAAYLGHGLDASHVWAANGSNEVIQQLLMAFGGPSRTAMGFAPSYTMHRLISTATGTGWVQASRAEDFTLSPAAAVAAVREYAPDVVFLTGPNNPTGTALPLDVVAAVLEVAPGMVVVDEAYAEFSRNPSALGLLVGNPRLVVVRTMSKAFGMAGLRLGYLAADPRVVEALGLVRLPYHLSALTQAAARVALAHADELLAGVPAVIEARERLVEGLHRLGCVTVPSDSNFVLAGGFTDEKAVWQGLLDRGVLIRDVGLPGWLRITAGLTKDIDTLLAAMEEVL